MVGIKTRQSFPGQLLITGKDVEAKPQAASGSRPPAAWINWKTPWWFGEGELEGPIILKDFLKTRYHLRGREPSSPKIFTMLDGRWWN